MPVKAERPSCDARDRATLESWANSDNVHPRIALRAKITLLSLSGANDAEIGRSLGVSVVTVAIWRKRFIAEGLAGLKGKPRPGMPPKYDYAHTKEGIISIIGQPPPAGQGAWTGRLVAERLGISAHKVWRIVKAEGITLKNQRNLRAALGCGFSPRSTVPVALFLDPPTNAFVLELLPQVNADGPGTARGHVVTSNGDLARRIAHTQGWSLAKAVEAAASEAMSGKAGGRRVSLAWLLGRIADGRQESSELHVFLDGLAAPPDCADWASRNPWSEFHALGPSALWRRAAAAWLGMYAEKGQGSNDKDIAAAIERYAAARTGDGEPFVWLGR